MNTLAQSLGAAPLAPALQLAEITSEQGLAELAKEWKLLSEQSPTAMLFNSYEWVHACWHHFDRNARSAASKASLWVLALREDGHLVAVAPLWIESRQRFGVEFRIARWIGDGPSDYGDLLLSRLDTSLVEKLAERMAGPGSRCDQVDLRECRGDSPALPWLRAALERHASILQEADDNVCYSITTSEGWEAYASRQFSGGRRKGYRREWRRLSEAGGFEWHMLDRLPDVVAAGDAYGAVQASHVLAGEARPGEFNHPTFRPFLEAVLTEASSLRWLRAFEMKRHGRTVAYLLAFAYGGRYFLYNTAHAAESQPFGAGKLMMLFVLETLFEEGAGPIDFLRGAESYKEILTGESTQNRRLTAARGGAQGHFVGSLSMQLMPALERRLPRLHRLVSVAAEAGLRGMGRHVIARLVARMGS